MASPVTVVENDWTELAPVGFTAALVQSPANMYVEISATKPTISNSGLHWGGQIEERSIETDNPAYALWGRPSSANQSIIARIVY